MPTIKPYLARIDFLDHSDSPCHEAGLIPITVWGVVIYEDDQEYRVLKWCANRDPADSNSECWCILKHPQLRIEYIRSEVVEPSDHVQTSQQKLDYHNFRTLAEAIDRDKVLAASDRSLNTSAECKP